MYLTRVLLNPARRGARKLLSSPQAMHAAILAGYPNPPTGTTNPNGRILWRLDHTNHHNQLYVLSPDQPDFTHLIEQAGWPTTETWDTRPYQPLIDGLTNGQRWAFRLSANPVRNRRTNDTEPTKRYGHVTVEQQRDWLLNRTKNAGFTIPTTSHNEPDLTIQQRITKTFKREQKPVTIRIATYEGHLEITDTTLFQHTLTNGLGHAKAYGCGLLTLAPVHTT